MVLSEKYDNRPEAIASYDYVDLATGEGYRIYYGLKAVDDTTEYYILSSSQSYSDEVATDGGFHDSTSFVQTLDLDFDLTEFQKPQTIKGTMYAEVPMSNLSVTHTSDTYAIIKLRKWDGSSETEIANGQTKTVSYTAGAGNTGYQNDTSTVKITVPETDFKVGETLRVTVELWGKGANAGPSVTKSFLGHSPNNLEDTSGSSTISKPGPFDLTTNEGTYSHLRFHVPFQIDD